MAAYELVLCSEHEYIVYSRFDLATPLGSIRLLGGGCWGWFDLNGRHAFATRHEAAEACIRTSAQRRTRQTNRYRFYKGASC